jgi:hypothetical protein
MLNKIVMLLLIAAACCLAWTCPECGAAVPEMADECPKCGHNHYPELFIATRALISFSAAPTAGAVGGEFGVHIGRGGYLGLSFSITPAPKERTEVHLERYAIGFQGATPSEPGALRYMLGLGVGVLVIQPTEGEGLGGFFGELRGGVGLPVIGNTVYLEVLADVGFSAIPGGAPTVDEALSSEEGVDVDSLGIYLMFEGGILLLF